MPSKWIFIFGKEKTIGHSCWVFGYVSVENLQEAPNLGLFLHFSSLEEQAIKGYEDCGWASSWSVHDISYHHDHFHRWGTHEHVALNLSNSFMFRWLFFKENSQKDQPFKLRKDRCIQDAYEKTVGVGAKLDNILTAGRPGIPNRRVFAGNRLLSIMKEWCPCKGFYQVARCFFQWF